MKSKDKIARLKEEIDMNMVPNVVQAGGSPEYCFGDLVDIGYAEKLQKTQGNSREEAGVIWSNSINTIWYYGGDKQIGLRRLLMNDVLNDIEVLKMQSLPLRCDETYGFTSKLVEKKTS